MQAHADTVTALAVTHGLEPSVGHGRLLRGWALAMQGHVATGMVHIQQGLATVQETGPKMYRPYWLSLLAEAYGQAGQPEAGLEPFVPRISFTLPLINAAREVVFLVAGEGKADAVARAFGGEPDPAVPASLVRPASGALTVFADAAATAKLEDGAR